jgi:hypothetical protein
VGNKRHKDAIGLTRGRLVVVNGSETALVSGGGRAVAGGRGYRNSGEVRGGVGQRAMVVALGVLGKVLGVWGGTGNERSRELTEGAAMVALGAPTRRKGDGLL